MAWGEYVIAYYDNDAQKWKAICFLETTRPIKFESKSSAEDYIKHLESDKQYRVVEYKRKLKE